VVVRVKEDVQDDANALRLTCCAEYCVITLGCATENEQDIAR